MSNTVYYGFIARDSDMIVFEYMNSKEMKLTQFHAATIELLVEKEKENNAPLLPAM